MGLDTCKYRSPKIQSDLAAYLEQQCIQKSGIHLGSGEVIYEFTSGELLGSWDSRISFRILREEWISNGKGIQQIPCQPYIEVEASLHKFFSGQNIYGSPTDFQMSSFWFLKQVFKKLGVNISDHKQNHVNSARLPSFWDWQVCRIDVAEVYQLTPAAISEFFRSIIRENIVDLDISQELSSFVATTNGVNGSPTLLKRTVNSKLSIKSGEVVIFAGLNEKKTDENESRFFGFSLGHRNNSGDSEILVFVEAQRI